MRSLIVANDILCFKSSDGHVHGATQACAEPGDIILFNGKILHRGRANVSNKGRGVLYVSGEESGAQVRWYDDSYQ